MRIWVGPTVLVTVHEDLVLSRELGDSGCLLRFRVVRGARLVDEGIPTEVPTSSRSAIATRSLLMGMMAIQAAIHIVAVWAQEFTLDDFLNLGVAERNDLTVDYLSQDLYGHFVPGHRLVFWLDERVFDSSYIAIVAFVIAVLVLSTPVLYRVLRLLFVPRTTALALSFVYAVSPLYVPSVMYPSAGLEHIPSITLTLVSLWMFLEWADSTRIGWLVGSLAAFAATLLLYEKPVLIPGYVVFLWIVHQRAFSLRQIGRAIGRITRILTAYVAVDLLYVLVALRTIPGAVEDPTVAQVGGFVWAGWARGFVPGYLGFGAAAGLGGNEFTNTATSSVSFLAVFATQLLVVGLVVYTVRRTRRSLVPWLFLVMAFLLHSGPVAIVRAADLGPIAAYRFFVETLFLFTIAAGVAIALAAGASRRAEPNRVSRRFVRAAAITAALALVVASLASTVRMREKWPGSELRVEVALSHDRAPVPTAQGGDFLI